MLPCNKMIDDTLPAVMFVESGNFTSVSLHVYGFANE